MKTFENGTHTSAQVLSAEIRQHNIFVDGYKIKLNFPVKSEKSVLNDIKHIMLGGVVRI